MKKFTIGRAQLASIVILLGIATAVGAENLQTMRAHFDCGWWEHLRSGREEVSGAAGYHIVMAGSLSADLGQSRAELEEEGRRAAERVYHSIGDSEYDRQMHEYCQAMRAVGK